MAESFKEMREIKRRRHQGWREKNLKILHQSGATFTDAGGGTLLFREQGYPKVDFYPSTGRWKCGDRVFSGGADAFLTWYGSMRE
jgi:hypothetical protein